MGKKVQSVYLFADIWRISYRIIGFLFNFVVVFSFFILN